MKHTLRKVSERKSDQHGKTSRHDKKDRQKETEASKEEETETTEENQIGYNRSPKFFSALLEHS
jgi:hypothetical protein